MLYQAKNDKPGSYWFFFETDWSLSPGHKFTIMEMGSAEIVEAIKNPMDYSVIEGYRMSLSFCPDHREFYTVTEVFPVKTTKPHNS